MKQDVLVLGVGGMGSAACFHLAKRGVRVTGIEQFDIAHSRGSSHGETRMIRKAYFEHPDYVPMLKRAYELWSELEAESGSRLYHETGVIYSGPEGSELLAGVLRSSELHQIPVERLSEPRLGRFRDRFQIMDGHTALLEPEAGFLEVENCVSAHATLAIRHGARIITGENVRSWSAQDGDGGVTVVTDKDTYRADRLVITAGAWSGGILAELKLPLKILRKVMFWFPADEAYRETGHTPCFLYEMPYGVFYGFPKLEAGGRSGLKAAEHSGGQEIPDPTRVNRSLEEGDTEKIRRFVHDALPGVTAEPSAHQTCMYTMTPDQNFIIDFHPRHQNVVFAAGFSGHGFKFASVIGEILSDRALSPY